MRGLDLTCHRMAHCQGTRWLRYHVQRTVRRRGTDGCAHRIGCCELTTRVPCHMRSGQEACGCALFRGDG